MRRIPPLKNDITPEGRRIWDEVERAARDAPKWTREHVSRVCAEKAKVIADRITRIQLNENKDNNRD